ncbi:hypothetical protein LTR60_002228, partial [Cryomyces antarcticus]
HEQADNTASHQRLLPDPRAQRGRRGRRAGRERAAELARKGRRDRGGRVHQSGDGGSADRV